MPVDPALRRPPAASTGGWLLLGALPMLAFLVAPVLVLLAQSTPGELTRHLGTPEVQDAIRLSGFTSLLTVAITVLAGTPLAYLLARREFPGRALADALIDLPMVLPPAVAGIALLLTFGRMGPLGGWLDAAGLGVTFTTAAVVLAQIFVAAPYYVRAATVAFSRIDRELELAAALDGGNGWRVWRHITLPLSWPGLLAGMLTCWARALGEFGATLIFAGNLPGVTQTMPLAIYVGFEMDLAQALVLAAVLAVLSFAVMVGLRGLLGRPDESVSA